MQVLSEFQSRFDSRVSVYLQCVRWIGRKRTTFKERERERWLCVLAVQVSKERYKEEWRCTKKLSNLL